MVIEHISCIVYHTVSPYKMEILLGVYHLLELKKVSIYAYRYSMHWCHKTFRIIIIAIMN